MPVHVLLVTALPAEARPLIDHWRLRRDTSSQAFPVYINAENTLHLIVSGIGKINAAAACAHLISQQKVDQAIWLNVGIAGHATHPLGTTFIAHSITDSTHHKTVYPPLTIQPACPTEALISLDSVSDHYPENALVDMEASAFYSTATRYSTAELVQTIKVISDNRNEPSSHITPETASQLITGAIGIISDTIDAMQQLAAQINPPPLPIPDFLATHHFTTTQYNQCIGLLRHCRTLEIPPQQIENLQSLPDARAILHALQLLVHEHPVIYL